MIHYSQVVFTDDRMLGTLYSYFLKNKVIQKIDLAVPNSVFSLCFPSVTLLGILLPKCFRTKTPYAYPLKVKENAVYMHILHEYLVDNNILIYEYQSSFIKRFSSNQSLVQLTDIINDTMKACLTTSYVVLDYVFE